MSVLETSDAWSLLTIAVIVGVGLLLRAFFAQRTAAPATSVTEESALPPLMAPSVNYFVTRDCNYECRFCFHTNKYESGRARMVPLEDAKKAMRMLRDDAGMQKINFSGGEPFLCGMNFLGPLCQYCKVDLGQMVSIVSNGSLMTEEWLAKYGRYVDMVALSCDSCRDDVNQDQGRRDAKTRRSQVDILREKAALLRKYGVQFKLNTTVTAHTWDEDMNWLLAELRPMRWKVFEVLRVEGENWGQGQVNERDASDLWLDHPSKFASFVERHKAHHPVVEDNDTMRTSYVLVDEHLRFLDCTTGKKIPSKSILEVGVQAALRESNFYDEAAFYRRDGDFFLPDVEDLAGTKTKAK
jgi:radical S-adenosyl methionine domain-containing protein 2